MKKWGYWLCVLFLMFAVLVGCTEKSQIKLRKQMLRIIGGDFKVKVYNYGQEVAEYTVKNGYVWFEETQPGVVFFKDAQGRIVRVGAWGGVVIVEQIK